MANVFDDQFKRRIAMHVVVCDPVSADIIQQLWQYAETFKAERDEAQAMRNVIAANSELIPIPHKYVSTACFHWEHIQCRKVCKFCPARCSCECHGHESPTPPSQPEGAKCPECDGVGGHRELFVKTGQSGFGEVDGYFRECRTGMKELK